MIESYEKAGKIVSQVRSDALKLIKNGLPVIDLVNFVETQIIEKGGYPAFPCNVSINEVTAHYTSPAGDNLTINSGDLVKLDLGAQVNGFIADSATSVLVDGYQDLPTNDYGEELAEKNLKMIDASREALNNALSIIKKGVELQEIGKVVEETINSFGFVPVANLTGHSMDQWILHSGLSIPNISERNSHKLEEGDVLAIEPFATDGVGYVTDMPQTYIFKFLRDRPMRMLHAKKVLNQIKTEYKMLPFSQRWLIDSFEEKRLNASMRLLIKSRAIYPYHVLREKSGAWVSQAEHTVIVEKEGCQIITE
ncbi:type II methionyl aminopeptidase [Methanobacterium alcaliphilum]|uniref:type II methionyl aminopeptidase n=1 Tax=Methanobacterium alcaliphilum TaxID=392018 RepID=UPI00200A3FDE|nr:type II methionyl aminopeptidase [Methanobacterium alcaliphilum]MCK9152543.1 type II methionyl aminopeptidase [Methanobacterium alcaliphilum]